MFAIIIMSVVSVILVLSLVYTHKTNKAAMAAMDAANDTVVENSLRRFFVAIATKDANCRKIETEIKVRNRREARAYLHGMITMARAAGQYNSGWAMHPLTGVDLPVCGEVKPYTVKINTTWNTAVCATENMTDGEAFAFASGAIYAANKLGVYGGGWRIEK